MKDLLTKLAEHRPLSTEDAANAMHNMLSGNASPEQIAGFLLGIRARGETLDELVGMTRTMRKFAVPVSAPAHAIDIVGTGGDRSGSFNVSTTAAFVCAGAGAIVAKHGNRSVSSKSGASDVLSALGVQTHLGKKGVEHCLEHAGMAFLFAPHFHPAMKHVQPVRIKLGVRSAFNILGPMCNPAGVKRQLVGAFSIEIARLMVGILHALGAESIACVHADDGMDECSITSPTTLLSFHSAGDPILEERITPEQFGLTRASHEAIAGGDAARNAVILREILSGVVGAPSDIVLFNAGLALHCSGRARSIEEGIVQAELSIDSGKAMSALESLIRVSQDAPPLEEA